MNSLRRHKAFTLIEVLIAMAMVVALVTAAYGAYFAMSSSARHCRDVIDRVRQSRFILERIATQLRCVYVPQPELMEFPGENDLERTGDALIKIKCFEVNLDPSGYSRLSFITTKGLIQGDRADSGLFQVGYRLDSARGELWYYEQRYQSGAEVDEDDRKWIKIADSISRMDFEYYDGRRWSPHWKSGRQSNIPKVVRIHLEMNIEGERTIPMETSASLTLGQNVTYEKILQK